MADVPSPQLPSSSSPTPELVPWRHALQRDLSQRAEESQYRRLTALDDVGPVIHHDGRELVNLASNDYLGLSRHPRLIAAAVAATQAHGTGAGASRLVSGTLSLHAQAEAAFAQFKHAAAALLFPTGYMANLAVLTSLAQAGDVICLDKLCHASLIDAARASGATVRVFPHLDYAKLDRLLERTSGTAFIVTDSIFSMDGDVADLPALVALRDRYDAVLVVDEAHGTGVLPVDGDGSGLCAAQGVAGRVDVVISTASKALGALGGIVTADQLVIDTLINRARSFIYTTAVPAAQAAALLAAVEVVRDEPWRRKRLYDMGTQVRRELAALGTGHGWTLPQAVGGAGDHTIITPILPVITGSSASALAVAEYLRTRGFYAPAIRPPTVAPQAARVRLSLRADLDDAVLERLVAALRDWR